MAKSIKSKIDKSNLNKKSYRKWILLLWALFVLGIGAFALFMFAMSKQNLPTFDELENPDIELATNVYAAGGEKLRRYFVENRVQIPYEEINPHLINSLISTEDKRFKTHAGIDFEALGRVAVKTAMLRQNSGGGGSTITQQLAKLLYTGKRAKNKFERAFQKFKEWITAVRLEKSYTKEEIIMMYLNEFDFINGANGIQAASETYFGKNQESLSLQESAVLVGMLKNPYYFNPKRFNERSIGRRNVVLSQVEKADFISPEVRDSLQEIPIDMSNFKRSTHVDGLAPYLGAELAKDLRKLLNQDQYRKSDGTAYNIYRDGLKVFTTIDYKMQALAEEVMIDHMRITQKSFFKEWKNEDPWTYEDENIETEIKEKSFVHLLKETNRFQKMFQKEFGGTIAKIEKEFDIGMRQIDITRLVRASESSAYITKMLSDKLIGKTLAAKYRKIIKSDDWKAYLSQRKDFDKNWQTAFDEKVKMTVFDYDAKGFEKDTIMSPRDSLKYHRMHLQTGVLAISPDNGHVKVWIGGINYKKFKFDHIRADRQVGSTFKPFVYASAIFFKGISPCFKVEDQPYTISPGEGNFRLGKSWTPKNARGEYERKGIPLFECLRRSKNSASVFLMKQLGDVRPILGLINNMGLDSSAVRYDGQYRIPRVPSICLGSADLTVHEMTGAYTTFANKGVHVDPILINRIEDRNGKVVFQATPSERVVLDEKRNYVMVKMLTYATSTAGGFRGVKSQYGGKTGTTNDHTDGWFMGITPDLVVGTWVGGEDKWIRFRNFSNGQGSKMARPFFAKFIKRLEERSDIDYDSKVRFEEPAGDLGIVIDCDEYELLNSNSNPIDNPTDVFEEEDDFEEDF